MMRLAVARHPVSVDVTDKVERSGGCESMKRQKKMTSGAWADPCN
jgi:hypothetical protein